MVFFVLFFISFVNNIIFFFVHLVSGIHVSTENSKFGLLMDAGEGTLGQMYRFFGADFEKVNFFSFLIIKFIF